MARSERKLIVTLTSGMRSIADNTLGGSIAYRSSKAAVNSDAQSGDRSCSTGHHLRGYQSRLVMTDMGGPHASLTTAESVTMLRRLIEGLWPAQSGKFFNYDGSEYAW